MVQKGKRNKNASLDNYRWGIWAYQEPALRNTVNFSFDGQLCVTAFRKVCYCWTMALWNLWNELKVQKTNVTAKLTLPIEHEWKEKGDAESFCFVLLLHCRILSFSMNVNLLPHCSHPCDRSLLAIHWRVVTLCSTPWANKVLHRRANCGALCRRNISLPYLVLYG